METSLPRIMVGRHEYEVDMPAGELRYVKDKSKALEFFKMDTEGDKLSFWYNHESQKIVQDASPKDELNTQRISFLLQSLDPNFSNKIASETEEAEALIRSGKSAFQNPDGAFVPDENQQKHPGLLPIVNLYGTEFFLDLRQKELRQVDDPSNAIAYAHLRPDAFHFKLWYNTTTRNAFTGTVEQAKGRNDIKVLTLPPLDLMIRDGIQRHEDKLNRECDLVDTMMERILAKGDDDFFETKMPFRAESKPKGAIPHKDEPERRIRRKGRGI